IPLLYSPCHFLLFSFLFSTATATTTIFTLSLHDALPIYALQFEPDRVLSYYIALALWAAGLYIWWRIDRSMDRYALDAASQDEDSAASVGIDVTREKLKITAISAAMCAVGGAIYAQYQMYIGP